VPPVRGRPAGRQAPADIRPRSNGPFSRPDPPWRGRATAGRAGRRQVAGRTPAGRRQDAGRTPAGRPRAAPGPARGSSRMRRGAPDPLPAAPGAGAAPPRRRRAGRFRPVEIRRDFVRQVFAL